MFQTGSITVHFKWFDDGRIIRRFMIDFQNEDCSDNYTMLIERLTKIGYNANRSSLWWIDAEGDHILLDDANALSEALRLSSDKMIRLISCSSHSKIGKPEMHIEPFDSYGRRRHGRRPCSRSSSRSRSRGHSRRSSRSRSRRSDTSSGTSSTSSRSSSSSGTSTSSSGSDFLVIRKGGNKMGKKWKKQWKKMGRRFPWQQECDNGFMRLGCQHHNFFHNTATSQQRPQEIPNEVVSHRSFEPGYTYFQKSPLPPPPLPSCLCQKPPFPGLPWGRPHFDPHLHGYNFGFHSTPPHYDGSPHQWEWDPRHRTFYSRRFMCCPSRDWKSRRGGFCPPELFSECYSGYDCHPYSHSHSHPHHHHHHRHHHHHSPSPYNHRGRHDSREASSQKIRKLEKKLDKMSMDTTEEQKPQQSERVERID